MQTKGLWSLDYAQTWWNFSFVGRFYTIHTRVYSLFALKCILKHWWISAFVNQSTLTILVRKN